MKTSLRLPVFVMLAALTASALASGIVGTWKGHLSFDTSKMPKQSNPQAQQMMHQQLAAAQKMVITMTFKADKTYSATATGGGPTMPPESGTWSQSGKSVSLKSSRKGPGGKPDTHTQVFTLSANGKTMSTTLPSRGGGVVVKVTFTR